MGDINLVIKIPRGSYAQIIESGVLDCSEIVTAIRNGVPFQENSETKYDIKDLFRRVENIERQMKEDKEEQITYNYTGVYTELPSNCNPGDVATLMICFRGGKTIYRNYICYEENIWVPLVNKIEDGKLKETEEQKQEIRRGERNE